MKQDRTQPAGPQDGRGGPLPHGSGSSVSVWMGDVELPVLAPLDSDARADVCIIGAGMAGLSTAYLLSREGRSVIVLDDGRVAGGETERTTAHLVNALDDRYYDLERLFGEKGSRLAAGSHSAAIDRIETIVRDESISCGFERLDGYLLAGPAKRELLARELEAAHRAGLRGVELVAKAPLDRFDTGACLRFPNQGQLHPLRYLAGLVSAVLRRGGRIHTGTHAAEVEGGTPSRVKTATGHVVTSEAVVVATNSPIVDRVAIHTKQAAYRTYVIAGRVRKGTVARALYWDFCERADACRPGDPYHYVRLAEGDPGDREREWLVVGGGDHKTGQAHDAEARFAEIEAWTRMRFPLEDVKLRWSGQVLEPIDSLAFIGHNPLDHESVYVATGDSGNGMTHGTIAGILLTDLIQGRSNPWAALYEPSRKTLRAAADFARENLDVVTRFADWVTPADRPDAASIAPGDGAVLRRGIHKIAAYRDPQGMLHERSAVCPHLGCLVSWNAFEKTWDCPCHGSRFDATGGVLNGPSNQDLARLEGEPADRSSGS